MSTLCDSLKVKSTHVITHVLTRPPGRSGAPSVLEEVTDLHGRSGAPSVLEEVTDLHGRSGAPSVLEEAM